MNRPLSCLHATTNAKEKDQLNGLLRRLMLVAEELDAKHGPEAGE